MDAYVDDNRVLGNSKVAKSRDSIEAVDLALMAIANDLNQAADEAETAASKGADLASSLSLIVLVGAGLLSLLLTLTILRSIVTPIKKMVVAMTAVAKGELDVEVPPATKDEIGELARALGVFKGNAVEMERLREER